MKTVTRNPATTSAGSKAKSGNARWPKWIAAAAFLVTGYVASNIFLRFQEPEIRPARVLVLVPNVENANSRTAIDGIVKASISAISSPPVLKAASAALSLSIKPGFSGPDPAKKLLAALDVHQEANAPAISIAVNDVDPDIGIAIANYLSSVLTDGSAFKLSPPNNETSEAFVRAQADLLAFEHGEGAKTPDLEQKITAMQDTLRATASRLDVGQRLASESKKASVADVLSGKYSPELATPRLEGLLARYPTAKARLDGLSEKLGPLHPELQAQRNDLDQILSSIKDEMRAISANAAKQLRDLKALQARQIKDLSDANAQLKAIEQRRATLSRRAHETSVSASHLPAKGGLVPANVHYRLISKATIGAIDGETAMIYNAEGIFLGLLAGLALLIGDRVTRRREKPVFEKAGSQSPKTAKTEPLGILQQIEMLEEMWPDTGRTAALPVAANDEPVQRRFAPARQVVAEMSSLRRQARQATDDPSAASFEQVLADMQALRAKVQWHAAIQERQKRASANAAYTKARQ